MPEKKVFTAKELKQLNQSKDSLQRSIIDLSLQFEKTKKGEIKRSEKLLKEGKINEAEHLKRINEIEKQEKSIDKQKNSQTKMLEKGNINLNKLNKQKDKNNEEFAKLIKQRNTLLNEEVAERFKGADNSKRFLNVREKALKTAEEEYNNNITTLEIAKQSGRISKEDFKLAEKTLKTKKTTADKEAKEKTGKGVFSSALGALGLPDIFSGGIKGMISSITESIPFVKEFKEQRKGDVEEQQMGVGEQIIEFAKQDIPETTISSPDAPMTTTSPEVVNTIQETSVVETGQNTQIIGLLTSMSDTMARTLSFQEEMAEDARLARGAKPKGPGEAMAEKVKLDMPKDKESKGILGSIIGFLAKGGKGVGKGFAGLMKGIAKGLAAFGNPKVLAGIGVLTLAGVGLGIALVALAFGFREMASVEWSDMGKAGIAILGLIAVLAAMGGLMMSPIGLAILAGAAVLIGAIAGLGAAFIVLGKGLKGLAEGLERIMKPLEEFADLLLNIFKNTFALIFENMKELMGMLMDVVKVIGKTFVKGIEKIGNILEKIITGTFGVIGDIVRDVVNVIPKTLDAITNLATQVDPGRLAKIGVALGSVALGIGAIVAASTGASVIAGVKGVLKTPGKILDKIRGKKSEAVTGPGNVADVFTPVKMLLQSAKDIDDMGDVESIVDRSLNIVKKIGKSIKDLPWDAILPPADIKEKVNDFAEIVNNIREIVGLGAETSLAVAGGVEVRTTLEDTNMTTNDLLTQIRDVLITKSMGNITQVNSKNLPAATPSISTPEIQEVKMFM